MPIYEYFCHQCEGREEIMQKVGEKAPDFCSKCGAKNTLNKVVSSSSFQLKGGGWYKDLYSSTKPSSAEKSSASKSDGKKSA